MNIPDSFQIMGHTVTVKVDANTCDVSDAEGLYQHELKRILLKSKKGGHYAATFWHEVVHCVFAHTGMSEWDKDEDAVDRIGEALYQIIESME